MVKGAIAFAPLMRRWLGNTVDQLPVSTPFHYVIHSDSLLGIDDVERHFRSAHAVALEESQDVALDYFGADYRVPPVRMSGSECADLFDSRRVAAAYRTAEMSIDPEALAAAVRSRLAADPRITCVLRAQAWMAPDGNHIAIDYETLNGLARQSYDHVVNALWDGRLAVDQTLGLQPERSWLYRVKHYLRVRAPQVASTLPSTTIVLGAFGDVVAYGDGSLYLSWYPAGMRGLVRCVLRRRGAKVLDERDTSEMRVMILDGLRNIVPGVDRLTPDAVECCTVKAGIIFAWGRPTFTIPERSPRAARHRSAVVWTLPFRGYRQAHDGTLFGKMVADRIQQAN
jgi:hypothetical protein